MEEIEYNQCYYSPTEKHRLCTHKHYCILDENRVQLEQAINRLTNQLKQAQKDYQFIKTEGTNNSADYEETRQKIKIWKEDLKKLKKFQEKKLKKR